jgi:hypothetical protein
MTNDKFGGGAISVFNVNPLYQPHPRSINQRTDMKSALNRKMGEEFHSSFVI